MYYTIDEIQDAVEVLKDDDFKKLYLVAAISLFNGASAQDSKDVVHEAIYRVLRGSWKKIRHDQPFVKGLAWVVKSIAATYNNKEVKNALLVRDTIHTKPMFTSTRENVEYNVNVDIRVEKLFHALRDDEECMAFLRLTVSGLTKTQIVESMKISTRQYDTVRRRMIRKSRKFGINEETQ